LAVRFRLALSYGRHSEIPSASAIKHRPSEAYLFDELPDCRLDTTSKATVKENKNFTWEKSSNPT
jgi:hypothetical protein